MSSTLSNAIDMIVENHPQEVAVSEKLPEGDQKFPEPAPKM